MAGLCFTTFPVNEANDFTSSLDNAAVLSACTKMLSDIACSNERAS